MDMIFAYLQDSMIALAAAAVCAVIALAALWKLVSDLRGSSASLKCVWNKDAYQPQEGETRWLCATCGASSSATGIKPPVGCRMAELQQAS
jgi:hypothetical protein